MYTSLWLGLYGKIAASYTSLWLGLYGKIAASYTSLWLGLYGKIAASYTSLWLGLYGRIVAASYTSLWLGLCCLVSCVQLYHECWFSWTPVLSEVLLAARCEQYYPHDCYAIVVVKHRPGAIVDTSCWTLASRNVQIYPLYYIIQGARVTCKVTNVQC